MIDACKLFAEARLESSASLLSPMSRMLLIVAAACMMAAAGVRAIDSLPSFPAAPASMHDIMGGDVQIAHVSIPELAPLSLLEASAESESESLAEDLPSSEMALAAALPHTIMDGENPAAALALEVPSPATFLKNDPFFQEMQAGSGSMIEAEASTESESPKSRLREIKSSLDTLNTLYTNGYGPNSKAEVRDDHPIVVRHDLASLSDSRQRKAFEKRLDRVEGGQFYVKKQFWPSAKQSTIFPHSRRGSSSSGSASSVPRKPLKRTPKLGKKLVSSFASRIANPQSASTMGRVFTETNSEALHMKSKLKQRIGKFLSLAEMSASTANTPQSVPPMPMPVESTQFPEGFEHIDADRARMRAQNDRLKDAEYLADQAKAEVARLTAVVKERQAVIDGHANAAHRAHNNLQTMFAAQSGVFKRLPRSSGVGARGGQAASPSRRVVPQRLQRLEDERRQARRRAFNRGTIGNTFHSQVHGSNLGVAVGATSFVETAAHSGVHAPAMRDLPPQ